MRDLEQVQSKGRKWRGENPKERKIKGNIKTS